jgi:hypothetical protein
MKTLSLVVLAASFAFACGTSSTPSTSSPGTGGEGTPTGEPSGEATPTEEAPVTGACAANPEEKPEVFGAKLAAAGRQLTPLAEVAKDPVAYEDKKVLLTGVVRASCLKRGCWMEIRPVEDRAGDSMTVRFKDYEFFVPLNSRGATVTLDGIVNIKKLTAAEVAHLEEEGATFSNKKPDGTVEQIEITATGVEMCGRDRPKQ